ncbi:MAG: YfcE family phosphodiesterase, partial [Spirochaetaceae bacterium]|nr:YfcE family phosphodiesterase [Spirochaetaceae bacterium]
MNTLSVDSPSLVGSREDQAALEKKTSGKILVISDSHGEGELVEKIIMDFGMDCDALVFCGDGTAD